MTPASLTLARNGSGMASAAALTLWASIVGREADPDANPPVTAIAERVGAVYAASALDLIAVHVGASTDIPDAALRESVVRCGLFLSNTEPLAGFSEVEGVKTQSEYFGSALRRSGVMGLLLPWTVKRAGAI